VLKHAGTVVKSYGIGLRRMMDSKSYGIRVKGTILPSVLWLRENGTTSGYPGLVEQARLVIIKPW